MQEQNPHASSLERLAASVAGAQAQLAELEGSKDQLEQQVLDYKQVGFAECSLLWTHCIRHG